MDLQNPDLEGDSQSKIQNPKSKMILGARFSAKTLQEDIPQYGH